LDREIGWEDCLLEEVFMEGLNLVLLIMILQ